MSTVRELSPVKKDFLSEGGAMGDLIRKFDWSKTSMGPIDAWSDQLKNAVRLCVTSEFPTVMYLGPDYLFLYNDAYIPLVDGKHPREVLGLPLSECRKEVWPIIGPILKKVIQTHKIQRIEDLLVPIEIAGRLEEYYCTLSYTPIGMPGKIEAIFTHVHNNTAKVQQARYLNTLKELALRTAETKSVEETCQHAFKMLSTVNSQDLPFALLYMLDPLKGSAKLLCEPSSVPSESLLKPCTLSLKEPDASSAIWPLAKLVKTDTHEIVDISKIPDVPRGAWDEPPKSAILIPIRIASEHTPRAVLVAGISPRRRLDDEYLRLFNAIGSTIMVAIIRAQEYEKEQERTEEKIQQEVDKLRAELQSTISELKKANESLLKSKECYRTLANTSPVGIFHLDEKGIANYVNPKGLRILGFTEISVNELDKVWREALHRDDKDRITALWNKTLEEKLDHFKAEYRFVQKDASVVWVIGEAITEKDPTGKITGYILTLTDITRLKELLDRQLKVVDSLCHELRNPLSGIQGNIQLLVSYLASLKSGIQILDDKYKLEPDTKSELLGYIADSEESLDAMQKCAQHQKVVTDDVLDFSRLDAGKVELHPRVFDPYVVVKDSLTMLKTEIKKKEFEIVLHHSLFNFDVINDPDRLKQVILNLLTNAIKFTPKNGKIAVGFELREQSDDQCVLGFFVEDSGIGISSENQAKLFNRFAQAEQRTFSEYGGSGLGLSICKQLVELMGGNITVTSKLGEGSRFSFTVKCKKQAKPKAEAKKEEYRGQPTKTELGMLKGIVVLIVEDNIINQKLLKRLLEKYGFQCYVAANGREAVNIVKEKQNAIQAILADIEMPVLNGLDATKEIRQLQKDLSLRYFYIIGISGNARSEYAEQAKSAGMDAYFTKPYEIEDIVAELKRNMHLIRPTTASSQSMSGAQATPAAETAPREKPRSASLSF